MRARRAPFTRVAALLSVIALVGLLGYGLLATGSSDRIDQSLAEGQAASAPEFELPLLVPDEGMPAPRFSLELLGRGQTPGPLSQRLLQAFADQTVALRELRGTPVVLNFWASWCTPCREEAPVLERGWLRDRSRGVLYLGLNMQDLSDDARAFLAEFNLTYPTLREPGNEVATEFGATGIPETYFIDRRGRVVSHAIGVVTPELLRQGVRGALTGKVIGSVDAGERRDQR